MFQHKPKVCQCSTCSIVGPVKLDTEFPIFTKGEGGYER